VALVIHCQCIPVMSIRVGDGHDANRRSVLTDIGFTHVSVPVSDMLDTGSLTRSAINRYPLRLAQTGPRRDGRHSRSAGNSSRAAAAWCEVCGCVRVIVAANPLVQ